MSQAVCGGAGHRWAKGVLGGAEDLRGPSRVLKGPFLEWGRTLLLLCFSSALSRDAVLPAR